MIGLATQLKGLSLANIEAIKTVEDAKEADALKEAEELKEV